MTILLTLILLIGGAVTFAPNKVDASNIYSSCTAFNHVYPKGVAKSANTKNKVINRKTGRVTYKPFSRGTKVSSTIYHKAMKNNPDLDRDKDGIACER